MYLFRTEHMWTAFFDAVQPDEKTVLCYASPDSESYI